MSATVTRWLRWYEVEGDNLAGEEALTAASLELLQQIFGTERDDPMYDCYPVAPQHLRHLQPLIRVKLEFARFSYFLEADATG